MSPRTAREVLPAAADTLAAAGVGSPEVDARLLLAHVLSVEPGRLWLDPAVDPDAETAFAELVRRRSQREPLQHLTGLAHFRHLELSVGPGVFVPRPETEVMTGWAIDRLRELTRAGRSPFAVDLCSGSGAIAAALATETTGVRVAAVERSSDAAAYASENLANTGAELLVADMADTPADWDAGVDLLIANPPYIPLEAYASVEPEARDHDPIEALFSGDDGLDAIRVAGARGEPPAGRRWSAVLRACRPPGRVGAGRRRGLRRLPDRTRSPRPHRASTLRHRETPGPPGCSPRFT